jgi:hypothetical protein
MIDPLRGVRGPYQFNLSQGNAWGHAANVKRNQETGLLEGFVHLTPRPRVGDILVLRFSTGPRELIFRSVEWTMNVDDMYRVTVSERQDGE